MVKRSAECSASNTDKSESVCLSPTLSTPSSHCSPSHPTAPTLTRRHPASDQIIQGLAHKFNLIRVFHRSATDFKLSSFRLRITGNSSFSASPPAHLIIPLPRTFRHLKWPASTQTTPSPASLPIPPLRLKQMSPQPSPLHPTLRIQQLTLVRVCPPPNTSQLQCLRVPQEMRNRS